MKKCRIFYTTDVHGTMFPLSSTESSCGLLASCQQIERDDNTLIFDGGDILQGSPTATYLASMKSEMHEFARVISDIGYSAVTLGNHDFNYGIPLLKSYIDTLDCDVICANAKPKQSANIKKPVLDYKVFTLENGLRVGVFGLTTDYIRVWEPSANIEGFTICDTLSALKTKYEEFKKSCDFRICLYHGGFEKNLETAELESSTSENLAYSICENYDFHLMLSGHQHRKIENTCIANTHVVQTESNATSLARIDIEVDESGKAKIESRIIQGNPAPLPQKYHDLYKRVNSWLDTKLCRFSKPLPAADHLSMALSCSSIPALINKIQLELSGAQISCTSLGNAVSGFNREVTIRDVVTTYVYYNTLMVLEIDGKTLKQALERCAEFFALKDGKVCVSDDFQKPKLCYYNYDYYYGISYTIDVSKRAGNRIVSLKYKGEPIGDDDIFDLALNNYRATGAGGFEFFEHLKVKNQRVCEMPNAMIDYLKRAAKLDIDFPAAYEILT